MAVLVTLMLRGPQTLSELRVNAGALGGPADAAAVQAVLADLSDRAQPLVTALARQVGQSAQRYVQLICPESSAGLATAAIEAEPVSVPGQPSMAERLAALEARVAELESKLGPLLS